MTTVALPVPVRDFVRDYVIRRRKLAMLRAVGWGVTLAILLLLADCLLDRFLHLNRLARSLLLLGVAAGVVIMLAAPLRKLFSSRIDWIDAAGQIESLGRHFDQRLQTVASQWLAEPRYRASPQLLDAILQELQSDLRRRDPAKLVSYQPAGRAWTAALAAGVLMAGLLWSSWLGLPRLLERALQPWRILPPVTTTQLFVQPGNVSILEGQELAVHVQTRRLGDEAPILSVSADGKTWQRDVMAPAAAEQFDDSLGALDRDEQYFVQGGDAITERFTVHVLHPPGVANFRIRYTYPAYLKKPSRMVENTDGHIEAPAGSEANISIFCTEPLQSATLVAGGERIAMKATVEPSVRNCDLKIENDEKLSLEMVGLDGVAGAGPGTMNVHAIPDLPPVVRFIQPAGDMRLTPGDSISVTFLATDDYGVAAAFVQAQVNLGTPRQYPAVLTGELRFRRGAARIDLSPLNLHVGDIVRLSLLARDIAGQEQAGDEQRLVLISPRAIDASAQLRLAELEEAVALAGKLASDLSAPDALDSAEMLRQSLLRAIVNSNSPDLSNALAKWIDDVERMMGAAHRGPDRVVAGAQRAAQLQKDLQVVARGELAGQILAERENLNAMPGSDPLRQQAAGQILSDARAVELAPDAPDFETQLHALVNQENAILKQQTPINFAKAASNWVAHLAHPPRPDADLDARLSAAAQAEAVRSDANLPWARDLDLSARAAAALGPEMGEDYPKALAALQQQDLQHRPDGADALAARQQMAAWAAAGTQSAEARAAELAMQANADLERRDYASAQREDAELAKTNPGASELQQEMQKARQIDELRAREDQLIRDTDALRPQEANDLAARQEAVARDIEKLEPDKSDSRSGARQAIGDAIKRLEAFQALSAAQPIKADVSDSISQNLLPYSPLTDPAMETIDQRLTPSLRSLAQSLAVMDSPGADHSVDEAKTAAKTAIGQLHDAENALIDQAPLAAAQDFAQQAAAELRAGPQSAAEQQTQTSDALSRAWRQAVRQSAVGRLSQIPSMASILNLDSDLLDLPGAGGASVPSGLDLPAVRQWGDMHRAIAQSLNASRTETDPAGYEDALRAYFQALNQTDGRGK